MRRYRVVKVGYSFYVQRYGLVNYHGILDFDVVNNYGILDFDWRTCARFDDEESALAYVERMEK